jgi:chitooligosaccharide deacetylase
VSCLLAGGGALAATRLSGDGHTDSPAARSRVDAEAVNRVETETPLMSLTFDDGPDPRYTPIVLDLLRAAGVSATFFLIGRNAVQHPELVARIRAEGHGVANHTQDHLWLDGLPAGAIRLQLLEATRSLSRAGAVTLDLVRPPRGWTSPATATVCREERVRSVFWSDCLEAHLGHGVAEAAGRVAGSAEPGSIILCHDGGRLNGPNPQDVDRSRTVLALPRLLDGILAKGLRPVTVPELLRAGTAA